MRERPNFEKNKKLVRTMTLSIALLITAMLLLGGAISAVDLSGQSTKMNVTKKNENRGDPTGLDPKWTENARVPSSVMEPIVQASPFADEMHGYIAYAGSSGYPEGPCKFSLDNPGTIESLAPTESPDFIAGGTWSCEEIWYGSVYGSGNLWTIDPETGDMENIGGGGIGCHGLAWDPVYNRLYGTTGTRLLEYDPETGEQEDIGSHNQAGKTMIALAINSEGVAYCWDVLFSGTSTLFTVDLETGEATVVASMGEPLVYAQDGDFDWDTDTLWLAAYYSSGFLAYWDFDAQELVHVGGFEGGAEIDGTAIIAPCVPPEHDVGVKAIVKPEASGYAVENMEMQLLLKNYGANTEVCDAQMEIIKCESSGTYLIEEHFDGATFPPENWTTDYWKSSNTNMASGTAPEARVYRMDQYYGGQYYDNYIMTPQVDATGWEKILMKFRWAFQQYSTYGQYCNFFVKYRKNSTSAWKDVSPWDNPLYENEEGDLYQIDCYGFGQDLGEEFQVMFQYVGYYYYFNYFWLDDITIEGCGGCAEYAEINEGITLAPGEEKLVDFPTWTPSEWQNESYQNDWESYPVHGFTIMDIDQQPKNNNKWILLDLYYPWFYDIEVTEIGSPQESRSIPAQTFDTEATIKNVGQFEMCCIGCDIKIGQPYVVATLLTEYNWPGVTNPRGPTYQTYYPGYDDGWRDDHKVIQYYYGFWRSNTANSGGSAYEARLSYSYARADYHFYSAAIDTSSYPSLVLNFKSFIDHYSGSGLYTLEAGYSYDNVNWNTAWKVAPSGNTKYAVSVPIEGGSSTTYIGFWVKGNPYYFDYWYIDDVELLAMGVDEEFSDTMCQGDDLFPGQSRTFYYDPWTPEFLAQEETAWGVPYTAEAKIEVEGDMDAGNNICVNDFELDFWHDPALDKVTSPASGGRGDLLWDNGEPDGLNGLAGSYYYGYSNILIDDFQNEETWYATDGHFSFCWNSGTGTGNMDKVKIYFFEETGDCDPSMDEYAELTATSFTESLTGDYYFGRPEIAVDVEFDEVELAPGNWWVGFQPDSKTEDLGYMLTAENKGCEIMADLPYWGYPRWSSSTYLWGTAYDLAWKLTGISTGPPGINVYIQPGTESIDAQAINLGTFKEYGLTCYAEIWSYVYDPVNGSKVWEDYETIDLTVPLGGTKPLPFEDFTFADEGRYGLYLDMTYTPDDFPKNNKIRWGVGVDDTEPMSDHALDPPNPDGENDWYVNDVEVTLTASDPLSNDVSSGVKEIKYKVAGGSIKTIPGSSGTFLITQQDDGNDVPIEYWSIDKVGNEETPHNTFTVDMDQTDPIIDLTYEVTGGNPIQGWDLLFTATASDLTSTMDRVEFFLNDGIQTTVTGDGPTYTWGFTYHGGLAIYVRTDAYDEAGNMASDIIDPVTGYNSQSMPQNTVKVLHTS